MSNEPPTSPPTAVSYSLSHDDSIALFSALCITFLFARLLGELAVRLKQPSVMGELIAGIVLGKSVLGEIWPAAFTYLYGPNRNGLGFSAVTQVCVTFYMFVAGLEMSLKTILQKKKPTFFVGVLSMLFPLGIGFGSAYANPAAFGKPSTSSTAAYALFVATAVSITAVPVAAKTLRDLHLYRTEMGSIVMGAAVSNDLIGWCIFAIVLSISNTADSTNNPGLIGGIILSIAYEVLMLTLGLYLVNKLLPFIHAFVSFPAGMFGFVGIFTLGSAAFALYIGLHNTIGGLLVGFIIGNAPNAKSKVKHHVDVFVSHILAPIFFGSLCLQVNFVAGFDIVVVVVVFVVGFVGKLVGGFLGARFGGCTLRESVAVATCMNARGAMELILANVAISTGVASQSLFVALVLLAIITSLIPGPILRRLMMSKETIPLSKYLAPGGFVREILGGDDEAAIRVLCEAAGRPRDVGDILANERRIPTGYPDNIAVPHALVTDLDHPVLVVGLSRDGLDFHSRDDSLAHVVVLVLCPITQPELEQKLLTQVTALFTRAGFVEQLQGAMSRIEVLALMAIELHAMGDDAAVAASALEMRDLEASRLGGEEHHHQGDDAGQGSGPLTELRRHYSAGADPLAEPFAEAIQRNSSSSSSQKEMQGGQTQRPVVDSPDVLSPI